MASNSAALGQLLLRGWTMLAEACPDDCQVPLMRDPATMLGHCVSCHKVFDSEGNHVQTNGVAEPHARANGPIPAVNGTAASTPSSSPWPSPGGSSDARHSSSPAAAAAAAAGDAPATPSPAGASAINPQQPGAVTADPAATPAAGDATGGSIASSTGRQQQQQHQAEEQDGGREPDYQAMYQRIREQRVAREAAGEPDTTQILADKLVAGWGMLAHTCPLCAHPLLRNRSSGAIHCAICDLPVQIESSSTSTAAGSQAAGTAAAAAAAPNAAAAREPSVHQQAAAPQQAAAAAAGDLDSTHTAVLARLQRVLLAQLDRVSSQVEGCNPAAETGRAGLGQHLELAQALLGTLAAARAALGQQQQRS